MAGGVLCVGVGNATRLFDYFLQKTKTYVATFRFGEDYDTLDTTGSVLSVGGRIPETEEIERVIPSLVGEIMQIPPKYSAKNVNGKRGYALARAGVDFELPPKKVKINYIKFLNRTDAEFKFEIECGGGTYIRSIARDMAEKLGTYAAMSALIRTRSGPFGIENAVKTDCLTAENKDGYLIPCDGVLPFESVYADEAMAKKIFNGAIWQSSLADGTYKLYDPDGNFYGLAVVNDGILRARTKLC